MSYAGLNFQTAPEGVILAVKVVPGSSRTRLAGVYGDKLKVTLSAAPEKGKANKELIAFITQVLKLHKQAVSLHSGPTNPHKELLIKGLTAAMVIQRLDEAQAAL